MRRILIPLITVIGFLFADSAVYANDNDDRNFRARLRGGNEVPLVVTETRGKVKLKFDDELTSIKFRIKLRDGVRVTAAHLHCAPVGSNGPVVAFLVHLGGIDDSQDLGFQSGLRLILYSDRFVLEDCHGRFSNSSCFIGG